MAGGLLLACCGVGGVAVGGLIVLGGQAVNEQAQDAVGDYLAAVAGQDWEQAYGLLCEDDQDDLPLAEFSQRESARPRIQSYDVGDLDPAELVVPAQVAYDDGSRTTLSVPVEQNRQTGQFEVCGSIDETG